MVCTHAITAENVLAYECVFPCNSYKIIHSVMVSISCMARTVIQSLTNLMILISQSKDLMQLCLYYRELFKIALLMYCVPQKNPHVLSYMAFMCAVRNMILKHDFLAHVTCYFSKFVTLSLNLQQLLHDAKSQTAQVESLYYLRSRLPPGLYLPWLFLVLDLSSLCIIGSCRKMISNDSRGPFIPPILQRSY